MRSRDLRLLAAVGSIKQTRRVDTKWSTRGLASRLVTGSDELGEELARWNGDDRSIVLAQRKSVGVTEVRIRRFDGAALFVALDTKRVELGLSWAGVADQLWMLSSELNDRRQDHPISPSTLTKMGTKPRTSCQHALFMLRWLDRTPESFLVGAKQDDPTVALPVVGPDHRLRWSLKRLYATMNEKRLQEGTSWSSLATTLGCSPNQLTGLRTAKFATEMDLAMRIVQWIGRPAADFIYASSW